MCQYQAEAEGRPADQHSHVRRGTHGRAEKAENSRPMVPKAALHAPQPAVAPDGKRRLAHHAQQQRSPEQQARRHRNTRDSLQLRGHQGKAQAHESETAHAAPEQDLIQFI